LHRNFPIACYRQEEAALYRAQVTSGTRALGGLMTVLEWPSQKWSRLRRTWQHYKHPDLPLLEWPRGG